jgi:hypothetical protein
MAGAYCTLSLEEILFGLVRKLDDPDECRRIEAVLELEPGELERVKAWLAAETTVEPHRQRALSRHPPANRQALGIGPGPAKRRRRRK